MECNECMDAEIRTPQEALCPDQMPALAMTYSPLQPWDCAFDAETGLAKGTIFPALDKPFLEGACPCV